MKASAEKIDKNRVELQVEVEPERLDEVLNQAYRKLVRKANIPGFRPGKAPRPVFERFYGKQSLYEEAMEQLIPRAYLEAVADTGIQPVSQPEVDVVQLEEGKPVILKIQVDVKPEVVLGEYKNLKVERQVAEVSDSEVDEELEKLRNRYAKLVTIEEGTVEMGDIITIDYEGTINGEPFAGGSATDRSVEVGKGFVAKDFDAHLVGMSTGETREIPLSIPEDFPNKEVAGKEALITVTVKEIKRKELADLDDEFAKDVSEHDTLEALRAETRKKLENAAEKKIEYVMRNALISEAVAGAEVEVPASMVDARLETMMEEVLRPVIEQGMTKEDFFKLTNQTEESMRADIRPRAEESLKKELVIDRIAEVEGLEATEEEVDAELAKMAEFYRLEADRLREILEQRNDLDSIRTAIKRDKAVDLLVANAEIVGQESTEAEK
ncbi:trigger factor [Candidatus Desulforudis audaxviator MP104C]|uniref:Trigger factor n=1 Tax=Desulforudis audaxviator (strain MP104C) TaxID=477974 RepID=TIG_DESAP|nr:trigger factor [Candidatus Desulforudis audaxviator]B1I4R5.1 RecName: Full=Trigger factor; Short=TF; AltName: Full=PPIase [Candidatus Desulforudis audaxviator MP104C]ACA59986.1 trigger factor [Candidatus Desulforudis audaxviator MP104C]